jgi:pilus assembly protein TadC
MLTTGKMIFAAFFVLVFVIAMLWAYRKDSFINKMHFKGASKILVITILVLLLMFIYVKMRHRL